MARPAAMAASVAAYLILFCNLALFRAAFAALQPWSPNGLMTEVGLGLILWLLFWWLLLAAALPYLFKPVLIGVLVLGGTVRYFADSFGAVVDVSMMRNIFETDPAEVRELLSWHAMALIAGWGGLPALAVAWVRVDYRPFWREAGYRLLTLMGIGLALLLAALVFFKPVSLFAREHRQLRVHINPVYPVHALFKYWSGRKAELNPAPAPTMAGAYRLPGARHPRLLVLVVGETARAQNFSLNGYERLTNPRLAQEAVVSFSQVSSCGTATAESLPCMFSHLGREQYSRSVAATQENLLDALQRAGVAVHWRDNNSGCKGICTRVPHEQMSAQDHPQRCAGDYCHDEILLEGLDQRLSAGDQVIVLHQLGSHGPAYYRRYPPAFRRFTPECRSAEVQDCLPSQLVAAYDNSILYTDQVLVELIGWLKTHRDSHDSLLVYVSDHGESLGEHGLYLHGLPYTLAPPEQTRVPMIMWISPEFAAAESASRCLKKRAQEPLSHDYLFHSVLGAMRVRAPHYDPALDLFAVDAAGGCEHTGAP